MDPTRSTPRAVGVTGSTPSTSWSWVLIALVLISALLNVWAMSNWRVALDAGASGSLGVSVTLVEAGGWHRIDTVEAGSPVAAAGARVGDRLRLDHYADLGTRRALGVNESIGMTLRDAKGERHVVVKPVPRPDFSTFDAVTSWVFGWARSWIGLGLALLLALRAADQPAMRALALGMIATNLYNTYYLPGGAVRDTIAQAGEPLAGVLWYSGFAYFALRFGVAGHTLWPRRWLRRVFWFLVMLCLVAASFDCVIRFGVIAPGRFNQGDPLPAWSYVQRLVLQIVAIGALAWSWQRSPGQERERAAWVVLALGLACVAYVATETAFKFQLPVSHLLVWWDTMSCLSYALLAYAVLRHRVFDIGFAFNRVLVFSIASAIVVAVRVVLDWAAHKWLRFAVADAGVAVDAAITLVLVLLFVPLQQWVGTRVTRLFFRHWEDAAERLRGFVERAPHVTEAAALRAKLLAAVDAFAGSAGSAFYVREGKGYRRAESTLAAAPDCIWENDDAVVELRQARGAVLISDLNGTTQAAAGALALPITVRGHLSSFVLVGHKRREELYRPDELSLLARSVRSVGLDLEALRVEALERASAEERDRADRLQFALAELQRASAALGARAGFS